MSDRQKITPVILSGGSGTRLWPMSRPERPKQFLSLIGPESLFTMALRRVDDQSRFNPPIIVANAAHAGLVQDQLAGREAVILLEPCARNTAPAIALAALAATSADAPLLIMPSDQVISETAAFMAAVDAALPLVQKGWLSTFGIAPTAPETGYGYIKQGVELAPGVRKVERFIEKPDAAKASTMLAEGGYAWNGGIFLMRADRFLEELTHFAPEMARTAAQSMERAERNPPFIRPEQAAFELSPSDSVDYAVMEKADRVAVVPVSMGWSDVGSWDALYDFGSTTDNNHVLVDVQNCLVKSDGIRVAAVGVQDLIVVASGNDVLIIPRGRSQEVKRIIESMKSKGS